MGLVSRLVYVYILLSLHAILISECSWLVVVMFRFGKLGTFAICFKLILMYTSEVASQSQ